MNKTNKYKILNIIKKRIVFFFIIFFLFNTLITSIVYADDIEIDDETEEVEENVKMIAEETKGYIEDEYYTQNVSNNNKKEPTINSRKCVIYDRGSKRVIYGKNKDTKCAMASTTKIMTAIIVLEKSNTDLNKKITISQKAASIGGSRLGLKKGDNVSIRDLLYGLMLKSGNDAAIALAEEVGGNVEKFAEIMNNKAKELNLYNTHFVTPHGLDNPEHYTTAKELAILTDYALSNKGFKKIVGTKIQTIQINERPLEIRNTNELLGVLNGVVGVKTGFTNGAGRCLVTETIRGDRDLIVIVLGADTKNDRTKDSVKLIEYGFNSFKEINLEYEMDQFFNEWNMLNNQRIIIEKSKENSISLYITNLNQKTLLIEENESNRLEYEINSLTNIKAPIVENYKIGTIIIRFKNEIIDQVDILVKKEIKRKNWSDYFFEFCQIISKNNPCIYFM